MKKQKNKKGSQIGYAIAFMIFIGFVIFLLGIISPLEKANTDKSFILENLQNKIIENVSGNLTIASVYNCSGSSNLSKFYFTNDSQVNFSNCSGNYKIGLIRTENYIFASKIRELINDYNTSYSTLKDNLNVPKVNDFSLGFTYENGNKIEVSNEKNPSTDVFAKSIPIDYFNENSRERGYLKIGVW